MDATRFEATPKATAAAPRISVVVPARNEARNLPHVLSQLPADLHQVILVDGHSVDDTVEVARRVRPGIEVVHQTRKGKGNAMACGFARVTGDVVVMLDADGSADPGEIQAFVAALTGGADFAKGTRFAAGGGSHDITLIRRIGNAGLNGLVNVLFGTRYTDLCYGYNVFRASLLEVLELPAVEIPGLPAGQGVWGDGFEIETLINVRVAAAGAKITEVGSIELSRIHGESNLNAVTDGLRVLRTILAERRRVAQARRAARRDARQAAAARLVLRSHGRSAAVTTASARVPEQGGPATVPTGTSVTDLSRPSRSAGRTASVSGRA
jgi:glycosyltransferase involved in cell wall biosynthesis